MTKDFLEKKKKKKNTEGKVLKRAVSLKRFYRIFAIYVGSNNNENITTFYPKIPF